MEIAATAVSLSPSLMERPDELTWSRGVTRRSTRELRSAARHCAAKTRFVERLRFCEPITPLPNYSITQLPNPPTCTQFTYLIEIPAPNTISVVRGPPGSTSVGELGLMA